MRPTAKMRLGTMLLLLLPCAAVVGSIATRTGDCVLVAAIAATLLAIHGLYVLLRFGVYRASGSWFILSGYAVAFAAIRFNNPDLTSPIDHGLLGMCLLVPAIAFVRRSVSFNTGESARQAKMTIRQLLAREDIPETWNACRELPEVKELRQLVADDASPVLPLVVSPDVRHQLTGLAALECHPRWRTGQAETIIQRLNLSEDAEVRVAAIAALMNVSKSRHLQCLMPYLRDRSAEVRRATATALLWDARSRWQEVRSAFRQALADPQAAKDGPLPCSGQLPPSAIDDLIAWAYEVGPIGKRSIETIVRHCKKAIHEDGSPEALARVVGLVMNTKVPPGLRVELAHRLQSADEFPVDVAAKLIAPGQPTMLRLLAAGSILAVRDDQRAIEVLKESAKQPNRQIALVAAGLIQRFLAVDMGLPVGGELPHANSRQAAEVTRKVLAWATEGGSYANEDLPEAEEIKGQVARF